MVRGFLALNSFRIFEFRSATQEDGYAAEDDYQNADQQNPVRMYQNKQLEQVVRRHCRHEGALPFTGGQAYFTKTVPEAM
jgi:hypothetical protein